MAKNPAKKSGAKPAGSSSNTTPAKNRPAKSGGVKSVDGKSGAFTPAFRAGPLLEPLRKSFASGVTRPLRWRLAQLEAMARMLQENEGEFGRALQADLGKSPFETYLGEVGFILAEIRHARHRLHRWMRPTRTSTPLMALPGRSRIVYEPKGVVLVLAPWNFPLQLSLGPMVGGLAAGNCVVLKPSELAPATSGLLARLIPRYLSTDCVAVVEGDAKTAQGLLALPFDHVLFTGNGRVGRLVLEAAAKNLIPVTLELDGKSPVVVAADVHLKTAARRIVWGKFFNAGQTCIGPDYVLADHRIAADLLDEMKQAMEEMYGADPGQTPDYCRIGHPAHYQRLVSLLKEGVVAAGGQCDPATRYIAPTLLTDPRPGSRLLTEEVFGPLLLLLPVEDMEAAIRYINDRPKPLALYVFSRSKATVRQLVTRTSSGSVCVNDTLLQAVVSGLPWGGIGPSGMGAYHGHHGFLTFSHKKAVLTKTHWLDLPLRYPPYSLLKQKWLRRFL